MASNSFERHFSFLFATPRRRRGGMSERSDEIPESEGFMAQRKIPVVLHFLHRRHKAGGASPLAELRRLL